MRKGGYEVLITLNEAGGMRLAAATKGADGRMQIAILIDDKIISAPVVQVQLGRSFTISGLRDEAQCLGLVRDLIEWPDEQDMSAMTDWLEMIDQGNAATSWNTAAEHFRQNVTSQKWEELATAARKPLGAMEKRQLSSAKRMESVPGLPDGLYLVSEFNSSFTEKKAAKEHVTLQKEKDGRWRVIGYFID